MDRRDSVLIIEDDEVIRSVLNEFLTRKGFDVRLATGGQAGLDLLRAEKFDIIITDLIMPIVGGMDVLKQVMDAGIRIPVLVMTAYASVQTAVEAIRIGAYDYITKPFDLDELMNVITNALALSRLQKENAMLRMQLRKKYDFKELVGYSPPMQAVYRLIEKVAATDSTVLITGESGTGKELIARTIHYNSPERANGPFIAINCGAIPGSLLESELFGHEKGAFTGAVSSRMGRFELAQGGTLFLDEVGELDPALQVKLLRVLQEREFERVGGVKTIRVDVRIIAASNKDLDQATKRGAFREDLFYRLNVIPLPLPPLRTRAEDIPILLAHFVDGYCRKRNREPFAITADAMELLLQYPWPGNVRELENLVERLSILVPGPQAGVSDLPEKIQQAGSRSVAGDASSGCTAFPADASGSMPELGEDGIDLNAIVSSLERRLITQALTMSGGVRSQAARLLGLNRTTLIEKMKKMKLNAEKL